MLHLLRTSKYFLQRTARQAKFWKPKHYQAIPHYIKPYFIDIHDTYKLRTLDEVQAQLRSQQYQIFIERVIYNPTDIQADMKGRKAIIVIPLEQFALTQLQLERLKVLVGVRYNEEKNQLKLTCEHFDNYEQNHTKVHQMFFDIIMETKRAP